MNRRTAVRDQFALIAIAAAASLLGACSSPELTVDNAWIRTPRAGMDMTAAYLVLRNGTDETVTLVGAGSDDFDSVTLHESRVIDGVWRMIPQESIEIRPGAIVELRPGGLHLMLSGARRELDRGDRTSIRLQFADGGTVAAPAIVLDSDP